MPCQCRPKLPAVTRPDSYASTTAGTGAHLAGGALDVLRNKAGKAGIGLMCAAALGGGLGWVGPTGYLVVGGYVLCMQWPRQR